MTMKMVTGTFQKFLLDHEDFVADNSFVSFCNGF